MQCVVSGSFQPLLEAMRGHEVVILRSTPALPDGCPAGCPAGCRDLDGGRRHPSGRLPVAGGGLARAITPLSVRAPADLDTELERGVTVPLAGALGPRRAQDPCHPTCPAPGPGAGRGLGVLAETPSHTSSPYLHSE